MIYSVVCTVKLKVMFKTGNLALALLAMVSQTSFAQDWNYVNDVLVLDSSNFDKAVEEFDYIMIDFYAPWW